jgi:predicted phage gp36 major capsid-like protein
MEIERQIEQLARLKAMEQDLLDQIAQAKGDEFEQEDSRHKRVLDDLKAEARTQDAYNPSQEARGPAPRTEAQKHRRSAEGAGQRQPEQRIRIESDVVDAFAVVTGSPAQGWRLVPQKGDRALHMRPMERKQNARRILSLRRRQVATPLPADGGHVVQLLTL